jgi:hypothetical protein
LQVRLNYREPGITEREPDALDNLTEREPKSPMIASPAADNLKPLQVGVAPGRLLTDKHRIRCPLIQLQNHAKTADWTENVPLHYRENSEIRLPNRNKSITYEIQPLADCSSRVGVSADHQVHAGIGKPPVSGTATAIAQGLAPSAWRRLSAGEGSKGPRLYDWAYLKLADLKAAEFDRQGRGLWTRGLLIRRNIADGDLAYFSTWCPTGTAIETLVAVEGHRWAVADAFETAKSELGLDYNHNETRSWHGWHRHVALVMLAFAMLATIRHRANRGPEKICRQRCAGESKALKGARLDTPFV